MNETIIPSRVVTTYADLVKELKFAVFQSGFRPEPEGIANAEACAAVGMSLDTISARFEMVVRLDATRSPRIVVRINSEGAQVECSYMVCGPANEVRVISAAIQAACEFVEYL